MEPEEYKSTQLTMQFLAAVIISLEIEAFLKIAEHSLARKASGDLVDVIELAEALLKVKGVALRRVEKEKARGKKVQANPGASGGQ